MATIIAKDYRILTVDGKKGLLVDGNLILEPKYEKITVKVPGDNNVSTSLPHVLIITRDINWNYEIFQVKPLYEGVKIVSHWIPPTTKEHSSWHLDGTKLFNRELGAFYPDGRRYTF